MYNFLWFLFTSYSSYHIQTPLAIDNVWTSTQVKSALIRTGFPDHVVNIMDCIIYKESLRVPKTIHYNNNGSIDYGIAQINSVHLEMCNTSGKELLEVDNNLACGLKVFKRQGLQAWASLKKCKDRS